MFSIGQKIVCVLMPNESSEPHTWQSVPNHPIKNNIYTVRNTLMYPYSNATCPAVYLVEITNPINTWKTPHMIIIAECAFPENWFKPLEERKTDISIFEEMLKTKELSV